MSSIIVAAPPIFGECAPLLQMAEGLVARGHNVTALVGSEFAAAAAATGARVSLLRGRADFTVENLSGPERLVMPPGPEQLNWDHTMAFVGGLGDQHTALQELLAADPGAVLLCNSLFFGAWPVAMGAPGLRPRRWVAIAANPVVIGDDAATPFGPVPGLEGAELVAANRAANLDFENIFEPTRLAAQSAVEALGATAELPPYVTSCYSLPDAMVALTVPEFDFPRTTPPNTLTYAGTLPIRSNPDEPLPPWWNDLDSDRPVVVVTQGTVANRDLGDLVEPTLRALADENVLVIAALGRETTALSFDPPSNTRVTSYVPFDRLLPHADLLITNGGFGGTQHALGCGVPVIVAGLTEDKPMVAAHVAYHGVGLDLKAQTVTTEQIAGAVKTVLHNPIYRTAAQNLSKAYAGVDPFDVVETLVL